MRKLLAVLAVVAVVLLPGTPAWAHNQLVSSEPAADATLTTGPTGISLTFIERLNPDFTTIVVSDAAQQRVPASAPVIDVQRGSVTLDRALANGTYTVAYRVVSVDGHSVQGSYTFTLADPALPPASVAASAPAAAAAGTGQEPGIPTGVLLGIGAVGVLLAGVAAVLYLGRRRSAAAG